MPAWWMVEYVTRFQVFHHCWLIHHRFLVHFHCHHGAFQILPIFLDGTLQLLMELLALHLSLHIFLPACRAPLPLAQIRCGASATPIKKKVGRAGLCRALVAGNFCSGIDGTTSGNSIPSSPLSPYLFHQFPASL